MPQNQVMRVRQKWRVARALTGTGLAVLLFVTAALLWLGRDLPAVEELRAYQAPRTSKVYARDGRIIATLYEQNRHPIALDQIAEHSKNAVLAIEDSRFYQHSGVDPRAVVRAAWANLFSGELRQGAGTLTMQLARNLYLTNEKTFRRKVRESLLALRIEKEFTKDEILEMYLNQVYFGSGAYGIDAAAETYFKKNPGKLSVAESAMLAGLLQAPAHLNPFQDTQRAKKRQGDVLDRMHQLGYIGDSEYQDSREESKAMAFDKASRSDGQGLLKQPYFTTYAIREASQAVPTQDLYRRGLDVYTTLDFDLQKKAESILRESIARSGKAYNADNAAMVLIENRSGAIRAMVGGNGWSVNNQFNRAWQAVRQAGSSFKPFVYAEALEQGYSPSNWVLDRAMKGQASWQPKNYDGKYLGWMTLSDSLRLSRNVIAVQIINAVGPENVAQLAHEMGLSGELPAYPSLALGSAEVTPMEMAQAYAVFARGGETAPLHSVKFLRYPNGEEVPGVPQDTRRVLTKASADHMVAMLLQAVEKGTGQAAMVAGHQVAGKTGTTDEYRDGWFVGFTPQYTLAVWVGNDDRSPTWGMSGGSLPAQIFQQVMTAALIDEPALSFDLTYPSPQAEAYAFQSASSPTYHSSGGDIRAYTYTDSGQEVTLLTNVESSDYNYDSVEQYELDEGSYAGGEGWRYFEHR